MGPSLHRLDGPLAGLDRLLTWIVRLVWLNLCWTGLTLLGGVLLGVGPAAVAAHVVVTRWLQGDTDLPIGRTMAREWRRHFRRAAPTGLLTVLLIVSLVTSWRIAGQQSPVVGGVGRALSTVGLVLMVVLLPHLTWVLERSRLSVSRTLLAALAAGLGRPLLTLALLVIGVGWPSALTLAGWPGLLPVCGVCIPVLGAAWCVERVFPSSRGQTGPARPG
ncbi:DUF624 domain-containing protein [Microlunatus soli]|uniref:Uncharacterized membrane protein YesL n=1 Tax=Microlunatus soli TaxID=630515 RepID=A0A1H1RYR0_9ACTN|nr:DUF624 domain-containing protein [Microlunatus soli]SDS40864.1 Uncharacterized membrane protein YesL [Microlunatus soli]